MARRQWGYCTRCHQQRVLDTAYPVGWCDECRDASNTSIICEITKPRPLPRESIVMIREDDVQVGFLTQDYVDVIDHDDEGWITVRIKHWAKKPYRVTRAEGI